MIESVNGLGLLGRRKTEWEEGDAGRLGKLAELLPPGTPLGQHEERLSFLTQSFVQAANDY